MCTCDTGRPGTSQERDHLVQKGAWGLWKSTALSVYRHSCPSCAASPHSTGTLRATGIVPCSCPLSTPVIYRQVSSCTHGYIKGACVWSTTSVQSDRFSNPTITSCSCPRSKNLYLLFLGHRFYRTWLQHQVHVLLITQYPVIIHGPSSGESLVHRKQVMITGAWQAGASCDT